MTMPDPRCLTCGLVFDHDEANAVKGLFHPVNTGLGKFVAYHPFVPAPSTCLTCGHDSGDHSPVDMPGDHACGSCQKESRVGAWHPFVPTPSVHPMAKVENEMALRHGPIPAPSTTDDSATREAGRHVHRMIEPKATTEERRWLGLPEAFCGDGGMWAWQPAPTSPSTTDAAEIELWTAYDSAVRNGYGNYIISERRQRIEAAEHPEAI